MATGTASRDHDQTSGSYTYAQALARADEWGALLKSPETADIRAHLARVAAEQAQREAAAQADTADRQRCTLAALLRAYAAHLARRNKASAAQVAAMVERFIRDHSTMADMPANTVTRRDLAAAVRSYSEQGHPGYAAKLAAYASAAYNLALTAESDATAPAELIEYGIEVNPTVGIKRPAAARRNRTLDDAELRFVLRRLEADPRIGAAVIRLALWAGGQRPQQVMRATVADLDDAGTLRLYDPKGRRQQPLAHPVPLGATAAALAMERKQRAADAGWTLLFTSDGKTPVNINTVSSWATDLAAEMVRDGISASGWQLRDLRRTAETRLARLRISSDTRAHLLSHGRSGVQTRYDFHSYHDEKAAALAAWEGLLTALRDGESAGRKVVPFPGPRTAAI